MVLNLKSLGKTIIITQFVFIIFQLLLHHSLFIASGQAVVEFGHLTLLFISFGVQANCT